MRVHPYASGENGIRANAYLVESGSGVVAIDATLTVSDATAFRAQMLALDQPLLAVLLTHGHPDHYNGVTILTGGEPVPVIATAGVDRVIREWDAKKEEQWRPMFGDEWPSNRTFPNRIAQDGEMLTFGGIRFTVHDLGPGESHHDSYWTADDGASRAVFIGDVLFHGEHSYVSDGHTSEWLVNLDRARAATQGAAMIYPGHGAPGGPELYDKQRQYLEVYRNTVQGLLNGSDSLSDADRNRLVEVMSAHEPEGKLTFLIGLGADAVAEELRRAGA